jgi:hypothetical protein
MIRIHVYCEALMCACVWGTVVLMTIIAIVEEAFFESHGVKLTSGEE